MLPLPATFGGHTIALLLRTAIEIRVERNEKLILPLETCRGVSCVLGGDDLGGVG